jgi:hypothetical protein
MRASVRATAAKANQSTRNPSPKKGRPVAVPDAVWPALTRPAQPMLAPPRPRATVCIMSTVAEIESALAKLPVEAQCEVAAWLESRIWPAPESMFQALDEAERSLAEDGGIPVADVRTHLRQWITE